MKEEKKVESMVDAAKILRAENAVAGKGKPDSAELILLQRAKAEKVPAEEQVLYIYKGLGGLVSVEKAAVNRKNEAKLAKAKRSR